MLEIGKKKVAAQKVDTERDLSGLLQVNYRVKCQPKEGE